uniref:Uncharacterized protein n=1 Tax=Trichuris muris TaxID=70415 RepID=A0A5S6QDZ9_TRIMR
MLLPSHIVCKIAVVKFSQLISWMLSPCVNRWGDLRLAIANLLPTEEKTGSDASGVSQDTSSDIRHNVLCKPKCPSCMILFNQRPRCCFSKHSEGAAGIEATVSCCSEGIV